MPTEYDWNAAIDRLEGAYAPGTLRAYRRDFAFFEEWCHNEGLQPLPAAPETIAAFVEFSAQSIRPHTIKRRLKAIRKVHRLLRLPNPCDDEDVLIALRRCFRAKGRRQRQALGMTRDIKEKLIAACDTQSLQGLRNRALINLAYDLLCRRSELVALQVEDLEWCDDGGITLLVRRTKSDPLGDGRLAYASPETADCLRAWLTAAKIDSGPLFRGIRNGEAHYTRMSPGSVGLILKTVARDAGLPDATIAGLSGHSARVGAAQDLACDGANLLVIMTAGRWKSVATVARYIEEAQVRRIGLLRKRDLERAA